MLGMILIPVRCSVLDLSRWQMRVNGTALVPSLSGWVWLHQLRISEVLSQKKVKMSSGPGCGDTNYAGVKHEIQSVKHLAAESDRLE